MTDMMFHGHGKAGIASERVAGNSTKSHGWTDGRKSKLIRPPGVN